MANAIPVMSKPLALPPAIVEDFAQPGRANLVADPNSPPAEGAVHGNPVSKVSNSGTPDEPVYEYSKSVRGVLAEVGAQGAKVPQAEYQLPGGAIRTDW